MPPIYTTDIESELWKTQRTNFTIICTGSAASQWIYVCMLLWMTLWQLGFSEHNLHNLLVVQDKLFFSIFILSNILFLHGDCAFRPLIPQSLFVCSCLSAVCDFSQNIQESRRALSARQKRWFLQTFFFFFFLPIELRRSKTPGQSLCLWDFIFIPRPKIYLFSNMLLTAFLTLDRIAKSKPVFTFVYFSCVVLELLPTEQ